MSPERNLRVSPGRRVALAVCAAACLLAVAGPADAAIPYTAWVGNGASGSLMPINTATGVTGLTIAVKDPTSVAITPDGKTAWVVNNEAGTVTPVTLANGTLGSPITVGGGPNGIAITPDGTKAYVANTESGTVTPINLLTKTAGAAITVGEKPFALAISPDGAKVYVTNDKSNSVTPITVAGNTPGTPIAVGKEPIGIAITPDGKTAYVANYGGGTLTPINLSTGVAGATITVGQPIAIAISPDGTKAYVADYGEGTVTPVNLSTREVGTAIAAGSEPISVAITPDQATAYVSNRNGVMSSTVTPVNIAANTAGSNITVESGPDAVAVTPDQAPVASFTVTPGLPGSASSFDGSASTVAYGTITSYEWSFGDGETQTTATPTTTHVYAKAGEYTATLTETDSAGTSTTQVFTGQTVSRNGGPGARSTRVFTVTPPPPGDTAPPTVSGGAQQGQTLTEVHGTWTNEPTGFAYQWLRCNASGSGCTPIAKATAQTYTPGAEDVGHELRVAETASNAGGPGTPAESSATAVVTPPPAGTPPATEGPSTPPGTPGKPGAQPPTAGASTVATLAVISTRSLTMTRSGNVWVALGCPVSAVHGCRGTITLALARPRAHRSRAVAARCGRGCRKLGSAEYEARAGQNIRIRVHIASLGRRLLTHSRTLPVTLTASTFSGGQTISATRTITLRGPGRVA